MVRFIFICVLILILGGPSTHDSDGAKNSGVSPAPNKFQVIASNAKDAHMPANNSLSSLEASTDIDKAVMAVITPVMMFTNSPVILTIGIVGFTVLCIVFVCSALSVPYGRRS